eukprot:Skav207456  [mRNA]  locus=scaffold3545:112135:119487:+ [translate_table: standard]
MPPETPSSFSVMSGVAGAAGYVDLQLWAGYFSRDNKTSCAVAQNLTLRLLNQTTGYELLVSEGGNQLRSWADYLASEKGYNLSAGSADLEALSVLAGRHPDLVKQQQWALQFHGHQGYSMSWPDANRLAFQMLTADQPTYVDMWTKEVKVGFELATYLDWKMFFHDECNMSFPEANRETFKLLSGPYPSRWAVYSATRTLEQVRSDVDGP